MTPPCAIEVRTPCYSLYETHAKGMTCGATWPHASGGISGGPLVLCTPHELENPPPFQGGENYARTFSSLPFHFIP